MDHTHRMCLDCKHPVLAAKFHEHLKTKEHREKKMASKLSCGVCMSRLPMGVTKEVLMDVLQMYGRVRSCSINPNARTAVAEFEYRQAAEAFLGSKVYVLNQPIHTARKSENKQKRVIPPEPGVDETAMFAALEKASLSPTSNIEQHIGIILDFILLRDPARDDKIATIVEDLEEYLSNLLPECRAELFGSAVTELALPGDAIDISICDGPYQRSVTLWRTQECAVEVRKVLMNYQHKFASIEEIPDRRQSVIRFVHNSTRIVCNLVINDTASPRSSRKLRWILALDERIRLITVFVKYWAKTLKLINNAKFSGYAMTLLVFFYLQNLSQSMIPALRILHEKNIHEISGKISNTDPLRVLIEGFFSFYAESRLGDTVLSPYTGDVLDREIFILGPYAIPPEMKLYNTIIFSGASPLKIDTPMVLQDPYELNLNLTTTVSKETIAEFRSHCKIAYEMIRSRNLLHLLKAHCAPVANTQFTPEVNTSFRAARFLQPLYLVPEPKNEVVLTKKELFQRWLNVMFVILPDFLINFVRLQVEPQDVPAEQQDWEPRAKVARLSDMGSASNWNEKTGTDESMTRRWLCRGRPVVCSWQQRKKAAAELELASTIHPMEREVLISKHLEPKYQKDEVLFCFVLKVDEDKEMVRCFFENRDVKPEPFSTMAHALVTLLPLWINHAFEVGFSLRCVTGVYIPGEMLIGASQNCGPYAEYTPM